MYYLIYQITNKINGKIYIGQHRTNDLNDGYMGSGILIRRAEEKYGLENFEKTILFECSSEEEMNQKERELVNEEFIKRDDTYNLNIGGSGSWFNVNLNYTIEKRQAAAKKAINNFIQKNGYASWEEYSSQIWHAWRSNLTDDEFKQYCLNISNGLIEYYKSHTNSFAGKKHTDETKRKIGKINSKLLAGELNPNFGKHWYWNPETNEEKTFFENEVIPNGWIKGRYSSEKFKLNMSTVSKNTVWVYKDLKTKHIQKDQLQTYLNDGWVLGRKSKTGKIKKPVKHRIKKEKSLESKPKRVFLINSELIQNHIDEIYRFFILNGWDETKMKYDLPCTKTYFMGICRQLIPEYQQRWKMSRTRKHLKEMYDEYQINGFKGVKEKFNYGKSEKQLLDRFNKYINENNKNN